MPDRRLETKNFGFGCSQISGRKTEMTQVLRLFLLVHCYLAVVVVVVVATVVGTVPL